MSRKKWNIARNNKDLAADIAEEFSLEPLAALLLVSRGITDSEKIENFLFGEELFRDPFEFTDMGKAVERIERAVRNFEKIMIFGDYDADGVTSAALLYLYLSSNGADVSYYIPDRVSEGYGISQSAVQKFAEEGVKLIITVDNGISAVSEVEFAKNLGIDTVITDHHKVPETLPDAVAVVNPHRDEGVCEFTDYAGVGVAFLLCSALEGDGDKILEEYSDLAAIGTLADVVPVVDENRIIVKKGIEKINKMPRLGIDALKKAAGADTREFTASTVSYTLAPRINAAGRMRSAMLAMKLLLSETSAAADEAAYEIDCANRERQTVENEITEEAVRIIESDDSIKYAPITVVSGEGWHQGVIGIVASRLVSKYGKPAIVITTYGDIGKASCRSIEGFSIYDALKSVSGILTHFGGHTLAAGFGIKSDCIGELRQRLCEYCERTEMPFLPISVDFRIKPSYITNELLIVLGLFEPYGAGNPQPCFAVKEVKLKAVKPVGEGKHLRLTFSKDGSDITAMLFSVTLAQFPYKIGDTLDIAFKVEKNEFRGEVHPSVHIADIRFSDIDFYKSSSSVRLYEAYKSGRRLTEKQLNFLNVDRNFISSVYKFIRANKNFSYDIDVFCERSGCPAVNAAKALVALDVLCELGLIRQDEKGYSINENAGKKDLSSSVILKNISERRE